MLQRGKLWSQVVEQGGEVQASRVGVLHPAQLI